MIYELRIYHMFPDKMLAIHKRFAEATLALFERHQMRVMDFWEAFRDDPDWQRVKSESEFDGPIVRHVEEIFMTRVPYWPRSCSRN